eukprot:364687-Chlamydomonas_euryale.AAC.8
MGHEPWSMGMVQGHGAWGTSHGAWAWYKVQGHGAWGTSHGAWAWYKDMGHGARAMEHGHGTRTWGMGHGHGTRTWGVEHGHGTRTWGVGHMARRMRYRTCAGWDAQCPFACTWHRRARQLKRTPADHTRDDPHQATRRLHGRRSCLRARCVVVEAPKLFGSFAQLLPRHVPRLAVAGWLQRLPGTRT